MLPPKPDRSRSLSLGLIFATVCIDLLGFGLVLPLLPIYGRQLTADLSPAATGLVLGLLMSSYSLMQFIFAPIWGRVSDRVGRRPVLLFSLAGSTFFYAMFGMATLWHSLTWMFITRIGAGIAGATIPTAQAYIADVTPRDRRARGMALIGAAFGLGFTLGPLVGVLALLVSQDTRDLSPWPGYVASALSAVALLLALFKLPESYNPKAAPESRRRFDLASLRAAIGTPSIGLLLATGFFAVFSLANFEGTLSLMIRSKLQAPTERDMLIQLFLTFACVGLIQCVVQGVLVRRLTLYVSEAWLVTVGTSLSILGFVLLGITAYGSAAVQGVEVGGKGFPTAPQITAYGGATNQGGVGLLLFAAAVEVTGIAMMFPAIQSLLSRRTDPAEQGGILGAGESVSSIARITGMVSGVGLYHLAPSVPFWSAAAWMVMALLLVTLAVRSGRDWEPAEEAGAWSEVEAAEVSAVG